MPVQRGNGLLDVLGGRKRAVRSRKTVSAGVDLALALGLLLLAVGGLVATGCLHVRRKAPVPAGTGSRSSRRRRTAGRSGCSVSPGSGSPCSSARCAASPAPATSPGCASWSPANPRPQPGGRCRPVRPDRVLADHHPVRVPELRPEATKARLKHAQDRLLGHARQLMACTALLLRSAVSWSAVSRVSPRAARSMARQAGTLGLGTRLPAGLLPDAVPFPRQPRQSAGRAAVITGAPVKEHAVSTVPPIRREVLVEVGPATAFEAFTAHIGRWWPLAELSVYATAGSIEFSGTQLIGRSAADQSTVWGTVTRSRAGRPRWHSPGIQAVHRNGPAMSRSPLPPPVPGRSSHWLACL